MAEGLLRHDAGNRFEVFSAGTKPGQVRSEAIAAMRELVIDISGHRSKNVDEFSDQQFDYVLTVCDNAKESCPVFPNKTVTIHRNFEDPAAMQGSEQDRLKLFRRVRDEIRAYLKSFPPFPPTCPWSDVKEAKVTAVNATQRARASQNGVCSEVTEILSGEMIGGRHPFRRCRAPRPAS